METSQRSAGDRAQTPASVAQTGSSTGAQSIEFAPAAQLATRAYQLAALCRAAAFLGGTSKIDDAPWLVDLASEIAERLAGDLDDLSQHLPKHGGEA